MIVSSRALSPAALGVVGDGLQRCQQVGHEVVSRQVGALLCPLLQVGVVGGAGIGREVRMMYMYMVRM